MLAQGGAIHWARQRSGGQATGSDGSNMLFGQSLGYLHLPNYALNGSLLGLTTPSLLLWSGPFSDVQLGSVCPSARWNTASAYPAKRNSLKRLAGVGMNYYSCFSLLPSIMTGLLFIL